MPSEARQTARAVHRADEAGCRTRRAPGSTSTTEARAMWQNPRVRPARGRHGARRAARVGGMGRCGGRAGEAGRVSARAARAAGRVRVPDRLLRPLRPRLHPHAGRTSTSKPRTGIRKYGEFVDRAADLVVSYGGSLSGEHGDGQSRGALLPKMFGDELMGAFREFKAVWDPDNKLNPHKLVDAYLPTENLRLGADYAPLQPHTHFAFPDDRGSLRTGDRCGASAWASAASTTPARCARATW